MEFIDEKIMGLAFSSIPYETRKRLERNNILTTKQLIRLGDDTLLCYGIPKTHLAALDRLLRKHGLKRHPSLLQSATLRILTENSVIGVGPFADRTVGYLIDKKKFRTLRRLYYTVSNIDFTPQIREKIKITVVIPKPGTDTEAMKECNSENESRMHGKAKMKIIAHNSKEMREANRQKRKGEAIMFSKTHLQAVNHGHLHITSPDEKNDCSSIPFANTIIKHGYDRPASKQPSWKERATAYYDEVLSAMPATFVPQGREYLAWERFLDYVRRTYPNDVRLVLKAVDRPTFMVPEYFDTLDALGLGYADRQRILSQPEWLFRHIIVKSPSTGQDILLLNTAFVTVRQPQDPMLSLCLFEEATYRRTDVTARLKEASIIQDLTMDEYAKMMQDESCIVSIANIERMLLGELARRKGRLSTFVKRPGRGRQPVSFDLRVKDGHLLIREHCENSPYPKAYTAFPSWARDNVPLLKVVHEKVAYSDTPDIF